jgi:ribosome-binding protein aMBF1 (putative translation factor)
MAKCKGCGEESDELTTVKVSGKTRKLCEGCAELAREQDQIAAESETAVQAMMGFKGRR